ncbi:maleylpyruvate isomerase family mycothiol-dependent enzyme [Amycolatopsis samaneae]|uniref:Maleylpyruvate isomerase family mycothiol-dependent enzyme n=1 Tax=Amycolatopsis samaneae TaxID=664691 RepID=A0ABW5G8F1_9PSEU
MSLKHLARDERLDLAAFLETLEPSQWDTPTLCEGWRVRDVVAHMISYDELDTRGVLRRFAKGKFLLGRINDIGVAEYVARSPEDLIALLRKYAEPRGFTTGFGCRLALTDAMIHQQDIRRPLGLPRQIPGERLLPVLSFARFAPPIRGFVHARGVRLIATDLDWSFGSGPDVRGTAEALLMAMAGRRGVVGALSGPGQHIMARRLG